MERYPGPSVSETTIDCYYRPAVGRSVREDDFLPVEGQGRVSLEAGHQTAGAFAQAQVP
jgi:hypothetical protein